ncbi:MAG: DegQ family serine endoprotease [Desulfobulbaceae bacterium]|nr:DegQ family serine endoprotease [Desulfobulbaceae bacterium]
MDKMNPIFHRPSSFLIFYFTFFFILSGYVQAESNGDVNIALLDRSAKAFSSVVKKAGPAVVHVQVEKVTKGGGVQGQNPLEFFNDPFFDRFFGPHSRRPGKQQREQKQYGAGSGFIISSDGYILTNNHVVSDADEIVVKLSDKRQLTAKVIGTDPQSDVALIKVEANDLPVVKLGNSDMLEVGEWVIAIGNPFELNQTVTVGVVSAKGRSRIGINDYENFIQTDAAINPGNSGGPLLNIHGEVIGMNTAIFSRSGGYMGIGFAIPINMARNVEKQLKKHGKVTRGWLGVVIQDINEDLAKSFDLKQSSGVLIGEVAEESPAKEAGFQQGDVIITMDGKEINDVPDLRNRVAMATPETKVLFGIIRKGKSIDLTVTIGEQPSDLTAKVKGKSTILGNAGLSLQELTPELARQFGYEPDQGVLISDVEPDSSAAKSGLKSGTLLEEVNKHRVRSLEEVKNVLAVSTNPDQILLRVRINQYSHYVVLSLK